MKIKLAKSEWLYLIILLAVSYAVQIFVISRGGEDYDYFYVFIGIMMFFPAVGAIISLLRSREGLGFINWKPGRISYLLLSLVLPAAITLLLVVCFKYLDLGENKYFSYDSGTVSIEKELFLLGNQNQHWAFFTANFLLTGMAYSVLTGLVTVGEELGWRGYLQKKLLERNTVGKSLVFLGVVWGLWHLPIILDGYNYPEYPVLGGLFLFPLTMVAASFFLGWLTIKGRSFWPAVLAHGGVNSIMAVLLTMDFGTNKLLANFIILGVWAFIGLVSFGLLKISNS